MSWDSGNMDSSFGAGQMDFSSGSAQMDFSSGNAQMDFSSGNANFSSSGANKDNDYGNGGAQTDSSSRRERPPPTEEDTQKYRSYEWASNRVRYEYNENAVDESGMAPRDEELEKQLFGESVHEGLDFSKYASIPVHVERGQAPPRIRSFDEASLHPLMKENIKLAHYTTPTPVQTISIPVVTSGKDLMACAQTGSGKTAAFLIPTLSSLFSNAKDLQKSRPAPYELRNYKAEPLILIIAPTRELCSQIFDDCRRFTYRSSLRPCAVYGGADTVGQIRHLERGCDVLAAAPGRLMDFIQRGKIGLNRVKYLILDEADRMLDMGFEAIIRNIIQKNQLNQDRQTLLFSATFPRAIRALARDFLRQDYLFVKIGRVGGIPNSLTQHVMEVEESDKREALVTLLRTQPPTRTLIFVETKRSADSLDQYLYEREFPSTSIHGDRTQMEREDALLAFKRGVCPLLVATAVAARGIDIPNVMHVINYDMPKDMDEYIHRIGRTARQGKTGLATSFYNTGSDMIASELTKLLKECGQTIPECLRMYETDDITFDEDLDDEGVEQPSYAGQEYVPPENTYQPAADWECPSCSIKNFGSRQMCFKCQTAKPGGEGLVSATSDGYGAGNNNGGYGNDSYGNDYSYGDSSGGGGYGGGGRSGGKPGDWNCPECNVSNFGSRQVCFKCSAAKPEGAGGGDGYSGGGGHSGGKPGDWNCPECNVSNFGSRQVCFKCSAAKPEGAGGGDGYLGGGYGGGGNRGNSRPGDWDCPDCQKSNYASRSDCFKCGAARPEGLGAPPRREPRARREGDWDCSSCSAVNYSNRTECFKCHASKEEGGGDTGGYDNASSGYQQDFSSSNENTSSWDPSSAASGWSNSNTTSNDAATSGGGGWNAPKTSSTSGDWNAPAAPTSGGGWDSTPSMPAPVAQNLGDGFNENPSTPIVNQPQQQPSGGGNWNAPASTANVPSNSGGWNSTPSAPTNDSWNSNKPQERQKSGGWNEPVKSPLPKVSPVATFNTVKPTEPVSMGWGAAPTAGASGW